MSKIKIIDSSAVTDSSHGAPVLQRSIEERLDSGLILIEKPAVRKLNEAKKIEKEIIDRNLFFSEGYMYRYYPQIKKIIEILKTDQLGKLISMKTTFSKELLFKKKFFFFKKKKKNKVR